MQIYDSMYIYMYGDTYVITFSSIGTLLRKVGGVRPQPFLGHQQTECGQIKYHPLDMGTKKMFLEGSECFGSV